METETSEISAQVDVETAALVDPTPCAGTIPSDGSAASTTAPDASNSIPVPLGPKIPAHHTTSDSSNSKKFSFTDLPEDIQKRLASPIVVVYCDRTDDEEVIAADSIDQNSTVIFRQLNNCRYTLNARCTKVMIEYCNNCVFTLNGKIITQVGELWRCKNCTMNANTVLKGLQFDRAESFSCHFGLRDYFHQIVWAACEELSVSFEDLPLSNIAVGVAQMKVKHTDYKDDVDQCIMRFVGGRLLCELIVRLPNGFPTTEREAAEWDSEQEARVQSMAKENGIVLSRKKKEGPKLGRNDPCSCGSKKKYKNCCLNSTGLRATNLEAAGGGGVAAP